MNQSNESLESSNPVEEQPSKCSDCLQSFKEKIFAITVEPVIFLFSVSMLMPSALLTNLLLERVSLPMELRLLIYLFSMLPVFL